MNTYQVKQNEYRRPKPKNRLLVRGGEIVDHATKLAAEHEEQKTVGYIRWYRACGRDLCYYTERPATNNDTPTRNEYHAESIRLFMEATT